MNALAEDGKEALHDLSPLLGVASLGELHRSHHVGEQHRHLLSLPLQRTLAGADLLGEVLGDVGAQVGWSGGSADRSGGLLPWRSQPLAAGVAELLAGGVRDATARTPPRRE